MVEQAAQFLIAYWHGIILDTHLGDYSRTDPEGNEAMSPENPGPCYTSRAFAMAHIAMYDAYVGVTGEGNTYLDYKEHELVSFEDVPGTWPNSIPSAVSLLEETGFRV